jgi:hypothetical protein
MRQRARRKLSLAKETLRTLESRSLALARGGVTVAVAGVPHVINIGEPTDTCLSEGVCVTDTVIVVEVDVINHTIIPS